MITIEHMESIDHEVGRRIGDAFQRFAACNNIVCDYTPFAFVASENGEIVGVITGHSYYREAHISDLIVFENHRNKGLGRSLIEIAENYCMSIGVENINLSTYHFQAPDFYKKCGFEIEFIRNHREEPKLNKYFFTKKISITTNQSQKGVKEYTL